MTDCRRCGTETSQHTLEDDPLCERCAEWLDAHQQSRDVDQHSLGEWGSS